MREFDKSVYVKCISPKDGNYFFGYYDVQPFSKNRHLVHKASFTDRLQKCGDKIEIGYINLDNGNYVKLDETGAWNFQQGAMLQWNPAAPDDEIVYNSLGDGCYRATILNVNTGEKRYLDRPVANISPKGDFALSLNFSRLYDFRPGYGYAEYGDPFYWENHSENDGIHLIDMQSGKSKLIMSAQKIWEFCGGFFGGEDRKLVVNHITFNTDGSRFLLLARVFKKPTDRWNQTAIITANTDGSDMYLLSDFGIQSHYSWYDKDKVVFFCGGKELECSRGWGNDYMFVDKTHDGYPVADYFFDCCDNHMSFSPNRRLMLADTYPNDKTRIQTLRIYNTEKNEFARIGEFYSAPVEITDLRCDLHPRWDREAKRISFDSTHEGRRGVYMIEEDFEGLFDK